jgi:Spy/CpxP family protein refolding chaperone
MNDSSKIKLLAGLVVALVIINVSMMGYLWFAPHGPGERGGPRDGRGPAGLVIKELKFDDKQREQFEKLREEHHASMMEIDKASHQLHNQLFKSLGNSADSSRQHLSDSLIAEIAKQDISRETITFHHLSEVRKLCNPEQQKLFDDMIAKASERRPEGPPPPRER